MQSLLFRNLRFTIPTALAFTVLGYAVSLPMSFLRDSNAAKWQLNIDRVLISSIETERLHDLRRFQTMVALGGTVLGVVVVQATFVVHAFEKGNRGNEG
jgi:hypothetical protein